MTVLLFNSAVGKKEVHKSRELCRTQKGMKLLTICLLYLLLDCLVLPDTEGQILDRSMEIRNPDIDPSWYTGRGIRPVGRFGRRQAAGVSTQKSGYGHRPACFSIEENREFVQDE